MRDGDHGGLTETRVTVICQSRHFRRTSAACNYTFKDIFKNIFLHIFQQLLKIRLQTPIFVFLKINVYNTQRENYLKFLSTPNETRNSNSQHRAGARGSQQSVVTQDEMLLLLSGPIYHIHHHLSPQPHLKLPNLHTVIYSANKSHIIIKTLEFVVFFNPEQQIGDCHLYESPDII